MKAKYGIACAVGLALVPCGFAYGSTDAAISTDDVPVVNCVDLEFASSGALKDMGSISIKAQLAINGGEYSLYPTFDNPSEALRGVSESAATAIGYVKDYYGLDDFADDTWELYRAKMNESFDDVECAFWYDESAVEFDVLRSFFDIYENSGKNAEIVAEALQMHDACSSLSASVSPAAEYGGLVYMLPYGSGDELRNDLGISEIASSVNGFSTAKGIAYAKKYATTPNDMDYNYYPKGDCTNFTSQILEAGGVAQVKSDDVLKGWWHKKETNVLGLVFHKNSHSWTVADTFAKYMGVGYKTKNNAKFSANIKAGDFIALDEDLDGDWDHMGFVTAVKSEKSNGYYNYKVAQHTSNYHAWTSSATNKWETYDGKGRYARVRR